MCPLTKKQLIKRWFSDNSGPLFEATDVDFEASYLPLYDLESGPDDRSLIAGLDQALTIESPDDPSAAAGAYVDYDPDSGRYTLPVEHAAVLVDESSPAYLPGVFQNALGSLVDSPRITDAVKTGEGVGWHEHNQDVFDGCERGLRPVYNANLISVWLPALDEVQDND